MIMPNLKKRIGRLKQTIEESKKAGVSPHLIVGYEKELQELKQNRSSLNLLIPVKEAESNINLQKINDSGASGEEISSVITPKT